METKAWGIQGEYTAPGYGQKGYGQGEKIVLEKQVEAKYQLQQTLAGNKQWGLQQKGSHTEKENAQPVVRLQVLMTILM